MTIGYRHLFSWLHLSDLHFGQGDTSYGWNQKLVLKNIEKDILPFLRLQIQSEAAFVSMQVLEVRTMAPGLHALDTFPGHGGRFNLDDIRPPVRQNPNRGRAGPGRRQIDHLET